MQQLLILCFHIFIVVFMLSGSPLTRAEMDIGLQGGFSAKEVDEQDFQQYSLIVTQPLPWAWQVTPAWSFSTVASATAGVLSSEGEAGFVGSFGPWLVLSSNRLPVQITLGISPTVLSKRKFDDANFGSYVQFTSHMGVGFKLGASWYAAYRFQHMSNASISDNNPGLNTHILQLSRRF